MSTVVWFRNDLRLDDQPALAAAVGPIVPVFVWSPDEEGDTAPGGASRWWVHGALADLAAELEARGSRLILRRGPTVEAIVDLVRSTGAAAVAWNRRPEPAARLIEARLEAELRRLGVAVQAHWGDYLHTPGTILTRDGGPLQVFTPFSRACAAAAPPAEPLPAPARLAPAAWPASAPLESLGLLPTVDWAGGLRDTWQPTIAGGRAALDRFRRVALRGYATERDRIDLAGVSRLSPYLHWGQVGIRAAWHAGGDGEGPAKFRCELLWREFAGHLLWHFPHTAAEPLRPQFAEFPWRDDPAALRRWQRGETGYPLVDAAMRCLWHTGWMHNRARMIVASFLVKDLLLDWRAGAAWFADTLVDFDLPNNTLGWQWTAGCGADAAPYFRIFNPVLQARKFDPRGTFTRAWLPELAHLPAPAIHEPWTVAGAPGYPPPMVDHGAARERALSALAAVSGPA